MDEQNSKLENVKEAVKDFLLRRKQAYCNLFNPEQKSAQVVMKDLARFCRADTPCFDADPRIHALLEGRREVWLRIMNHLNMSPEEFWKKFGKVE